MTAAPQKPTSDECQAHLSATLRSLESGNWQPAYDIFDLLRDANELALYGDYALTMAMRRVILDEVRPDHYVGDRPPQRAYNPSCCGAELFEFAWNSNCLKCRMYLKTCFFQGRLVIHSFHKDKKAT